MAVCPICGNERGYFKRCYRCDHRGPRKHKTGEVRACEVCGTNAIGRRINYRMEKVDFAAVRANILRKQVNHQ